jgi:hypothetical protein
VVWHHDFDWLPFTQWSCGRPRSPERRFAPDTSRAHVIAPLQWNAVTVTYSFSDGGLVLKGETTSCWFRTQGQAVPAKALIGIRQVLGPEPAADKLFVRHHGFQCWDKLAGGIAFYNVAVPTDRQRFPHYVGTRVLAEEQDS